MKVATIPAILVDPEYRFLRPSLLSTDILPQILIRQQKKATEIQQPFMNYDAITNYLP